MEGVAQVCADRTLAHVCADQPHLPLAVFAQRAQQRGGTGAPAAVTMTVSGSMPAD